MMIARTETNCPSKSQDKADNVETKDNEEEWDWEEDDDAGTNSGSSSNRSKRLDSTSSRELSSAEGKYDQSSTDSTTRKLFTDMEFGAYNSDSMYSPGHSGQSDLGASVSEQSQVK